MRCNSNFWKGLIMVAVILFMGISISNAQTISIGSATGTQGQTVDIPVNFTNDANNVVGIQFDIQFDPQLVNITDVQKGSALSETNFIFNWSNPEEGVIRILITPPPESPLPTVPSGQLAVLKVNIIGSSGTAGLSLSNVALSDAESNSVEAESLNNGTITIEEAENQPPVINSFDANPTTGTAPLDVAFTCNAEDPDGSITEYRWDFNGDGQVDETTTDNTITHTYNDPGQYNATCSVVDDANAIAMSSSILITVNSAEEAGVQIHLVKGWNLKGTNCSINVQDFNNVEGIKTVWKWEDGQWYAWSPNEVIRDLIATYLGQDKLIQTINPYDGFWVLTDQEVDITISSCEQ